jgi:ABC-2 type transport system ATP-binding protein
MKQRLAIAAALIGDPPVLILDEPTNGLDPQGIAEVRNLIRDISIQGKTIIMASHILDEVEKVCSHVAIMHKGKLLSFGKVGEIINKNRIIEIGAEDISKLKETLAAIPEIRKVEQSNNILLLEAYDNLTASELGKMLAKSDIIPTHLVVRTRSLESEFLEITADKKTK